MKRTTFIFRTAWAAVLSEYPAALRLAVYEAVIRYAATGEVASLDDAEARMAFSFIRKDIDYDFAKFQEISERRSAAGRRGNESRWGNKVANVTFATNKSQTIANIANATFATNKSQTSQTSQTSQYENENENENKKKNVANATCKESAAIAALSSANADDVSSKQPTMPIVQKEIYIGAWNAESAKHSAVLPRIQTLTGRRLDMLRARINEHGKEKVLEAFKKAAASPFLNGQGDRGFIANIDWVLRPNNFAKVLEGNYDARSSGTNTNVTTGTGYSIGTTQIDNSVDKWEGEEEKWK